MHLLLWADSRTLIVCQCLVIVMFSLALLGMRVLYPYLRGVVSMAAGFLLGVPATMMMANGGKRPSYLTTIGPDLAILLCYVLLYRGMAQFCGAKGRPTSYWGWRRRSLRRADGVDYSILLYSAAVIVLGVLLYYTFVDDRIVPRVVSIFLFMAVGRACMSATLLRIAAGRWHVALFGGSLAAFAMLSLYSAVSTWQHGWANSFIDQDRVQILALLVSFLFICLNGMFYLALLANEVADTIEEQSQMDFLTGTLNRRGIERALAAEIASVGWRRQPFAILLMDVDYFKTINDVRGHAAGDEALCRVAATIESVVRASDRLSRYGGDEFLLLMPGTVGAGAMEIAKRIGAAVRGLEGEAKEPALSLSIGVTTSTDGEQMEAILARADAALYEAKRGGRDQACLVEQILVTAEDAVLVIVSDDLLDEMSAAV